MLAKSRKTAAQALQTGEQQGKSREAPAVEL